MADSRITELTQLSEAGLSANDALPIADISASETKKITAKDLVEGGLALADANSIDLAKLNQSSVTKLGTSALADDAVSGAKLANNSSIVVGTGQPVADNFDGRGFFHSTTKVLKVYNGGTYEDVAATVGTNAVGTTQLANGAVTTAKVDPAGLGTAAIANDAITVDKIADDAVTADQLATNSVTADAIALGVVGTDELADNAVTYAKLQNVSTTDRLLGRSSPGSGDVEEIPLTAAGRALLDDADAAAQRVTLGLGSLATQSGTFSGTHSGTSSGTNTGDQTITLTGEVTGSGTGSFATQISAGAVTAGKIAADAVGTSAIIASSVTEAKIAASAVTETKIGTGAVTATKIADGSISYGKLNLADGSIPGGKIAADSITNAQLGTASVASDELATDSVITAKIANNAVTNAKIATGAVSATSIASDAVTTAKIIDDAVTYGKIQNVSTSDVVLGRASAGSGSIEEIPITAAGRALIDDPDPAQQRITLGLGSLATQSGTFSGTHSGDSSGTNTGDQVISLTGAISGSGTGTFATSINLGAVGTPQLADAAVTYEKIQSTSTGNVLLGRSAGTAGPIEEIALTSAGRALLDDVDAAAQRTTLGLGSLATATGTWTNGSSFSGTSSGTNTGDQTITLTGDVTGTGTGSFATSIASASITDSKLATNSVTSDKINANAVTAGKLANNSSTVVSASTPSGSGSFTGQLWVNTSTGFEYTWTGTEWQRLHGISSVIFTESTPISFSVAYPDNFTTNITVTLDSQAANTVLVGPSSGANATPTFRALTPSDLPNATASTKGIVQPGTGLSVSSGVLNHSNSVTGATVSGITFDAQGHITAAAPLVASDIPSLDASKISTGTFGAVAIASDAITGAKLANYSTAQIGEALPVADFIGQFFFNPLDKNIYLWDGNVWQPVGVSIGELVFAGTYNASTNTVASATTTGAAAGLIVGNALPAASSTLTSYYVVVSNSGTGVAPAPTVSLAPPDIILCDGAAWREIDVSSTYTSQTAVNVGFTPAGTIAATNAQAAIEEVATDAANASNLTSGTVAVARGGTAVSSYTKGDILAASASTTLTKLPVGTNGQVLRANSATATGLEWGTPTSGTVTSVTGTAPISVLNGTTTPAISVSAASTSAAGVVQLSDSTSTTSSILAATPTAVKSAYDLANAALPKAGGTVTGDLVIGSTGNLVFEGATDDIYETTLVAADATADRTITLPNVTGTVITTGDTGTVTSTMIADGTISNVDINASAGISYSKLEALTSANILVGNSFNVATPVAVSGDITISNTGLTAIAAGVVVNADISATAGISFSKLQSLTSGNIIVGNASNVPTAVAVSGDITIDNTGATAIASGVIVNADINASAAIADTKLATISTAGKVSGTAITSGNISTSGSIATTSTLAVGQASAAANTDFDLAGTYAQTLVAVAALNIDCSTGNYFTKTINGNSTFTVSNVPASRAYAFTLELTHTSGTIAWFTGVEWPNSVAPTLTTGKTHLFMFVTQNGGTRWRASSLANYTT